MFEIVLKCLIIMLRGNNELLIIVIAIINLTIQISILGCSGFFYLYSKSNIYLTETVNSLNIYISK